MPRYSGASHPRSVGEERGMCGEDEFESPAECRRTAARVGFVLVALTLTGFAVIFTYFMIYQLVESLNHPVRSISYTKVDSYKPPGIVIFPGAATLKACGHYYDNVYQSKVNISSLNLTEHGCDFEDLVYSPPSRPDIRVNVVTVKGPSEVKRKEALFLHFSLLDQGQDFNTVSYYVFADWHKFNQSTRESKVEKLADDHGKVPTYALSAGMRMWIKISQRLTHFIDDKTVPEFRTEYSVIPWDDRRPEDERRKEHFFFIFFEWKNEVLEESNMLYTTTPWTVVAGLCGVLLTLHKGYQLARASMVKIKKEKKARKRRQLRKRSSRPCHQERNLNGLDPKRYDTRYCEGGNNNLDDV